MPNSANDSLYLLIRSLTRAEKRHFKLYASRNADSRDAKFIRLFDVLDGMTQYNEAQIFKKGKSIRPAQLANLKAHLYGELLVALRLLHSPKNLDIQIREQMDFARLLYNRGLVLQSLKLLDKAKQMARSNGHFLLTLEILQFEKAIEARHITRSIAGRAATLAEETNFVTQQVGEASQLSNLALQLYGLYLENGHIKNEEQGREMEALLKQGLQGINEKQAGFFGKAYLHQCYCWYYFIQLDFTRYYRHAEKWAGLFEQHPQAIKEDPYFFLKAIHNLLNALFIIGKHQRMTEEIDKLDKFYQQAEQYHENLAIQSFVYLYTARINLFFLEGRFQQGIKMVPAIMQQLKVYGQYIDTHRVMVFYYKIASLYFGSGDNDTAIEYLQKIINLKVGHLRSDIQCFARLLHLIAHYEAGNTEILEYLIKSVYRFLSKMENLDAVLEEILRFLRRSLSSRQHDVYQSFVQLRQRLAKVSRSKYARRSYQYLDIVSWLESKLEGIPVQEVVRRKFAATKK